MMAMAALLASAALMLVTTYVLLQTTDPSIAWGTVFAAGIAMAPVFPTTLGMVGDAFPRGFGWVGLAVSSRIIGALGGSDPKQLPTARPVLRGMTPRRA